MALIDIATWFVDTIVPAFKLPDIVHQLALSAHYGLPMLGQWDVAGLAASVVLLVGGVLIGAWGSGGATCAAEDGAREPLATSSRRPRPPPAAGPAPRPAETGRRAERAADSRRSRVDPLVFVLVAGAAVLHVTWNILLKTAGDPLRAAAVGMSTAALLICPLALVIWLATGRPAIPNETLVLSVVSGALEALYFAFLAAAYRRGDLSLVYPLARGTAPLLAVAIGVVVLHERLGVPGFLGVAFLLVGLLSLQRPWRYLSAAGRASGGAAGFALLTGVTIAAYSAVDRVGVRGTTPWLYAGLIWASGALFLVIYAWAYGRRRAGSARGRSAANPAEPEAATSRPDAPASAG